MIRLDDKVLRLNMELRKDRIMQSYIFLKDNGFKKINNISFGTEKEFLPLINELCEDEILNLFIGEGGKYLEYEK